MFVIRDDTRKTFYDMRTKKFVSEVKQAVGMKTHAGAKIILAQLQRNGYRRPMRVMQTIEKGTEK